MGKFNKILCALFIIAFAVIHPLNAFAAAAGNLSAGTYDISASLSCYVNAMGGIEFGAPLLKSSQLIVDESGNKKLKMNLTKSSITIYNITCDIFVDANPSGTDGGRGVKSGTVGYYDQNGKLQTSGVAYTLSSDTALNSKNEAVRYVDSITFPVNNVSDTYNLTLYINSNVMGVQFCNQNDSAAETTYPAVLTVDWSSVKSADNSSSEKTTAAEKTNSSASTEKADSNGNTESANSNDTKTVDAQKTTENNTNKADNSTSPDGEAKTANEQDSDYVVKKDGLNIHYANDGSSLGFGNSDDTDIPFTVYLNMPVLIGMAVFAGVLIITGLVLLYISKKQKEKNSNE